MQEWRCQENEPWIVMTGFGESAISFEVYVWINNAWSAKTHRFMLYEAVWEAFQDAEMSLPILISMYPLMPQKQYTRVRTFFQAQTRALDDSEP